MTAYAELQLTTNYSFLRGASHADELVLQAAALGHRAVAVADRNTLAGAVRAHVAAKRHGLRLVVGARLDLRDAPSLLAFPTDRAAYARLCRLITLGRRRAPKGECWIDAADLDALGDGMRLLAIPPDQVDTAFAQAVQRWRRRFGRSLAIAASHRYRGDDARRLKRLADLAEATGAPMVATNDVHYHAPERRRLQDVLACIRHRCTVEEAGYRLFAHAERHLKAPAEMARLFRDYPEAVGRGLDIAEACDVSLDMLRHEYPVEATTGGRTPQQELEHQAWLGAAARYPDGVPDRVRGAVNHELGLIGELGYASYFLTVFDIVRFARSRGILCQGRGSAANSAVCYCLGVTAVDPTQVDLLFERFVSAARGEPPDIDVDFEHERREEVIQYIYDKYGRDHAGLTAVVSSYRPRGAIRDVGKALGLSLDAVGAMAETVWGWGREAVSADRVREAGLDPADRTVALALELSQALCGFPRHLSQHVGGFVITRSPLCEVVPIENAAMEDRTVIQWDKDDLDALRILKVDVLALGMLSCVRRGFEMLERHYDRPLDLARLPKECPGVYAMLSRADSLGVFQVESRAQMTMLPRLRPQTYYDLVIEVAIVRPGPIQGDMVHPYLRRRQGREGVEYPSEALRAVLEKTLGVPLFQEQAMKIAMVAAGFTAEEADGLRRAMATFRKTGEIHRFHGKMVEGMVERGYGRDFAERCFRQLEGFGEYGFPESHAASFAHLVYVSAWLKCHFPELFCAALLNSQPMGFYAPAQIVRDARDHGVEVRPADVNWSAWDCTLEPAAGAQLAPPCGCAEPCRHTLTRKAVRLGLRLVKGLAKADGEALVRARGAGYRDPHDLWRRSGLSPAALTRLAEADAFGSFGLDGRQAAWAVRGLGGGALPLFAGLAGDERPEAPVALPRPTLGEQVVQDYTAAGLSLKTHPLALLRDRVRGFGAVPAAALAEMRPGRRATVAGLVLVRQRPGTAKGVIFVTLEDESGVANLVVLPHLFEASRRTVLGARLLACRGRVENQDGVVHLLADALEDWSDLLGPLAAGAELPPPLARADEVRRPGLDPRQADPAAGFRSRDFK
ncbi:MAG TPA: error-prone DNA polymerase [Alphaproteobacteria bacterium]|nr:error-prone DNA polymerase [Alphaproteobacteria bacterium]